MHYFVTGATGFIGRHLTRELVRRGEQVTVLLRSPEKRSLLPDEIEVVKGDLASFAEKSFEIPDVDYFVHLAGIIAAGSEDEYRQVNYRYLVDLMRYLESRPERPNRFVFASSLAAAGPSQRDRPHTEDDPLNPIEPYGLAKADGEKFLEQSTIPVSSIRPPIVLGPEDSASFTLFQMARRGLGFQVGKNPQQLSFVDVRDLVDAIIRMAQEPGDESHAYFASHPDTIGVDDIWRALGEAMDRSVKIVRVPAPLLRVAMGASTMTSKIFGTTNQLDEKQYRQLVADAFVCDSKKLRARLGWSPMHDLDATITNAVRGYRAAGWLPE